MYDGEGKEGEEFTLGLSFLEEGNSVFSWKEIFGFERKEEVSENV
ncbi:hypothetical protein LEP1GSC051_0332 [Leptospira sp. P2653]|nr:hypothetical protein LEP1GSC051_0332 [Leptospira sp. P2653]